MAQFEFDPLPAVHTAADFEAFVRALDTRFDAVNQSHTRLEWAKKWNEPYDPDQQASIDAGLDRLYTAENHETIRKWQGRLSSPYLQRWAEVLAGDFTLARLEQRPDVRRIVEHLADRYTRWRPTLDGREMSYTEQTRILRAEPDRELRRRAWLALWELANELEAVTRDLFALRNEGARGLGYPTFADLKLHHDDVSRQWLLDQIGEIERVTAPAFLGYLRRQADKAGIADVQPWDVQYLMDRDPWPDPRYFPAEKMEGSLLACAEALGIPARSLNIRVHWYDSPYGGQCMYFGPADIRILTSHTGSMLNYNTLYHEYGHALHGWYNAQPYTLRREPGMFTEGMAMLFSLFLHYPSWLRKTGLPDDVVERYREDRKYPWIYRHRRIAADVAAELAAWDDPTRDLNAAYGESTARYLGVGFQPRPFAAVPRWTWPVQLQSYFIADLISTQTDDFLRAHFKPLFGSGAAIEHIREHYWQPGNSIPWLEKVRRCTGEPLTYRHLAEAVTQPLPDA